MKCEVRSRRTWEEAIVHVLALWGLVALAINLATSCN